MLIVIIIGALTIHFQPTIHRTAQKIYGTVIPKNMSYIAGLSDEEQSFADSINKNVDVKLL